MFFYPFAGVFFLIMKTFRIFLLAFVTAFVCVSCQKDSYDVLFVESVPGDVVVEDGYVDNLSVSLGEPAGFETKGTYLDGVETVGHGALLLCYRKSTGVFEVGKFFTQAELDAAKADPSNNALKLSRVPVDVCDFYLVGNMPLIDKNGELGAVNMLTALGSAFPSSEASLQALVYRMDGSTYGSSSWRFVDMPELTTFGIPYVDAVFNVDVAELVEANEGITGLNDARRLFAKMVINVNHGNLDDNGTNPDNFVNKKIKVRYANCRFQPFRYSAGVSYSNKAEAGSDIWNGENWVDYDLDLASVNATEQQVVLYVPENMQGNLLEGNTDPSLKNYASLNSVVPVKATLPTFIQFEGTLSNAAAGLSGDGTYRFYPGTDNVANFDVEGGKEYTIGLTLTQGSVFWTMTELDNGDRKAGYDLTDSRKLKLTRDVDYTSVLGSTDPVAVRPTRSATLYAYANPTTLSGENVLKGTSFNSGIPASLSEIKLGISDSDLAALSARGISINSDSFSTNGGLTFTVTDGTAFASHIGETLDVSLTLLPGGASCVAHLVLAQDIAINWYNPVTDTWDWDGNALANWIPGQVRRVRLLGIVGNVRCADSNGYHLKWYAAAGEEGRVGQGLSGPFSGWSNSIDFIAWSTDTNTGCLGPDGTMSFTVEDSYNDSLSGSSTYSYNYTVAAPVIRASASSLSLDINGNPQTFALDVYYSDGTTIAPRSSFHSEAYGYIYSPVVAVNDDFTTTNHCVAYSSTGGSDGYGHPVYEVHRHGLGSAGSGHVFKGSSTALQKTMTVYSEINMRIDGWRNRSCNVTLNMLPLINDSFGAAFDSRYDDYTILASDSDRAKFDESFRKATSYSISASSGSNLTVNTPSYWLWAEPVISDANETRPTGSPAAVQVSQASNGGPLTLTLSDNGLTGSDGTWHTAGPHRVMISATNGPSGETLSGEITSESTRFSVFVHYIAAGAYDGNGDSSSPGLDFYATYMGGDNVYKSAFGANVLEAWSVRARWRESWAGYRNITDRSGNNCGNFYLDNYFHSSQIYPSSHSADYILSTLYFTMSGTGDKEAVAQSVADGSFWYGSQYPCQFRFDKGGDEYSELDYIYGNLKYSVGPYDYGYFIIHWLKDVCAESGGWLNVFDSLQYNGYQWKIPTSGY